MLAPITIQYNFQPVRRSLATAEVADLFGLADHEPAHAVCENLALDVRAGDCVLFVGPSGSGKSSLLRAVAAQVNAHDAFNTPLPNVPLVDALPGALEDRLATFAACGLSEARLLLRTPAELSEGQRYRFRLCAGFAQRESRFLCADEFTATLDRTLAKVVAFNVRKLVSRTGIGLLAATTHDDITEDLSPDVIVQCGLDGSLAVSRRGSKRRDISFARELWLSEGTNADWPYFARWHYRGHKLAFVKRIVLLWHNTEPIGICVFATPAASLALRSRYFGLRNPRSAIALAMLNHKLWLLQRVVLHPTYRGAGIAAAFVRYACESCPIDWIETLTAMGRVNPFFERAGFAKIGEIPRTGTPGQYGPRAGITAETQAKSRFANPLYYLFDNRERNRNVIATTRSGAIAS